MKLTDFPEVNNLPVQEKLELVDELWLSMRNELDSMEVTNEAKELLDERWAAFLADPGSALTIEEFRNKMKAHRTRSHRVN